MIIGMSEPPMTRADNRILSGGYILPFMGWLFWLVGVGGPVAAWLTNTPIYDRNTGQPHSALSVQTMLVALAAAASGTILIASGAKIRRTYQNGKRSGW